MGYYDEWESGMYDDYVEPTEDQLNDWNIHNDHQDDYVDIEDVSIHCDQCGRLLSTDYFYPVCRPCDLEYEHPLDIAEREELEDRSAGLEEPWWAHR